MRTIPDTLHVESYDNDSDFEIAKIVTRDVHRIVHNETGTVYLLTAFDPKLLGTDYTDLGVETISVAVEMNDE